jgi:hypothetical protein
MTCIMMKMLGNVLENILSVDPILADLVLQGKHLLLQGMHVHVVRSSSSAKELTTYKASLQPPLR